VFAASLERMCKTEKVPRSTAPTGGSDRLANTKHYGLSHLAMCASGICICYLYYGILQERLFTGRQRLGASFVLVTQCATNALVAFVWHCLQRQSSPCSTNDNESEKNPPSHLSVDHRLLIVTSGFYVAAMACSNEAIQYVSYPVAVLAKSCKLIPTMLVGQVAEGKLYSRTEWSAALLISVGIMLFHWTRQQAKKKASHQGAAMTDDYDDHSTYGMLLLLASLAMDGVLSSSQNFLKFPRNPRQWRPPTAVETMLYVNLYAVLYLVPFCLHNGQWKDGLQRMREDDSLVRALAILNGVSLSQTNPVLSHIHRLSPPLLVYPDTQTVAVGQVFIFLCITWFSPVVTTTITTTRKFLTIVLSVLTFGHSFTQIQWLAVFLVFTGLYLIIMVQRNKALGAKTKRD
jgi:UDP-galactose transporter B1